MKRSRGRSRKSGNQLNRQMDSNGPDVKIRGTASHIFEKYQSLARDAGSAGDRIMAENYLQHAEHYYRVVRAANGTVAKDNAGKDAENDKGVEDGSDVDAAAEAEAQPNGAANGQADDGDTGDKKAKARKPSAKADDDGEATSSRRRGRRRSANGASGNSKSDGANNQDNGGSGKSSNGSGDGSPVNGDGAAASGSDKAEDGVISPVASNDVSSDTEAVA